MDRQGPGSSTSSDGSTARCPVCEGTPRRWMLVPGDWRRKDRDESYQLYWCDTCEHGFLHPPPSLEQAYAAHDVAEYFTHHDRSGQAATQSLLLKAEAKLREHVAWRLDKGGSTPDNVVDAVRGQDRVVEIGCGKGELGELLKSHGHSYVGIEIDSTARERATQRGLEVYEGVAQSVPKELEGRAFDAVVMCHVLEHVTELNQAMETITKLLAPGGLFVVEVPNNAALGGEDAGATWLWLDVPRHVQFFTGPSMRRLCERNQLRVQTVHYTGFTRQFQDTWIEQEQGIHAFMSGRGHRGPRNGRRKTWKRLAQSALAPDARRYDSVMVVAKKF